MAAILTENALRVLEKRYLRKDTTGKVVETPDQLFKRVAANIAQAVQGQQVLILVSTDLAHYPPYKIAHSVDQEMLNLVTQMKASSIHPTAENLIRQYRDKELHTCICGEWALITTIIAAKQLGVNKTKLLKYANSGDVPFGKKNSVVGYGAVAFYKDIAP